MLKYTKDSLPQYEVGRGTYGVPEILYSDKGGKLKIGAFCSIAGNVSILLGGNHQYKWATTYPFYILYDEFSYASNIPHSKGDVIIGNDVWIGENATILSGVTIGDGVVIGACSTVAQDIPPYSIVVGNPARIIKKRFDDIVISRLISIQWWKWDDEKIKIFLPLMLSNDIEIFLENAEKKSF